MNERIKELMEQAEDPEHGFIIPEKFAELIVQECISINRQRMFSDYEGDSHRVAHNNALLCANFDMFDHFGVEEQATEPVELHSCPYAEELYGNYDKMCDCDEERTRQCAMDI